MSSPLGSDVSALTQAFIANAKRLGLTWTRRLATVVDGSDPAAVQAIFDGDTAIIAMTSMIGALGGGQRVYVDIVPPSANFIVGSIGGPTVSMDANTSTAGNLAGTSGAAEVAVASASWSSEPTYIFTPGFIYRVVVNIGIFNAGAATNTTVRVRQGPQSITGTEFARWRHQLSGGGALTNETWVAYIKNTTGNTVATKLSLTNQRGGALDTFLYGDADFRASMAVERYATVARAPGLAALTSSLV